MIRRAIVIVLVLALGAALLWWLTRVEPLTVSLTEVGYGKVVASVANTRAGTVEACKRTRLSPISGGRITYLGVKKGDRVKKGEILLRLWNEDLQAQSNVALAQVESAKKRIGEACAMADNAEHEAARMAKLREKGFVSTGLEEKARFEAQSRRAACDTVRAEVNQAQARVKLSRVEQGRTVLVAPFDGTIADIVGELGEYTTPSPPGVATPPAIDLIDDSCLYIVAPMDEVDAPKVVVDQPARITLDALPGKVLAGHVKRVAPYVVAVEKQSRTVDVEVSLDQPPPPGQLLVGYSADVEIMLDVRDNVLRIPTSAIIDGNKVLRYKPETRRLEQRTIKIGLSNWEFVEVLDGLAQGDRIATSLEHEGVRAGVLVQPDK